MQQECQFVHMAFPFNTSHPYLLLPVSAKRRKRFLHCRLSSRLLSNVTGKHHRPLFLDHLDFAHIVQWLALGMHFRWDTKLGYSL